MLSLKTIRSYGDLPVRRRVFVPTKSTPGPCNRPVSQARNSPVQIQSPAQKQCKYLVKLINAISMSIQFYKSHMNVLILGKLVFVYSAVSSPSDCSKHFTLSAPRLGRPVHSDINSASPGNILAMQQLRAKTKSLTFPPLSISRYSFKQ